jgi:hypothetical protein
MADDRLAQIRERNANGLYRDWRVIGELLERLAEADELIEDYGKVIDGLHDSYQPDLLAAEARVAHLEEALRAANEYVDFMETKPSGGKAWLALEGLKAWLARPMGSGPGTA